MSVNKVILVGRLGMNPEMRKLDSGTSITKFSIATNRRVRKGEAWEEKTQWHRVTVFGRKADACGEYLSKGSQVFVEGHIETSEWVDKDGMSRFSTEVIASQVQFLASNKRNQVLVEEEYQPETE